MSIYLRMTNPYFETESWSKTPKVNALKIRGFDGVASQDGQNIVFDSSQIKSATGNKGAFSADKPGILDHVRLN